MMIDGIRGGRKGGIHDAERRAGGRRDADVFRVNDEGRREQEAGKKKGRESRGSKFREPFIFLGAGMYNRDLGLLKKSYKNSPSYK